MNRIFVDSSVLYSALGDVVELVYSNIVLEEVARNIARKAPPDLPYRYALRATQVLEYTEAPSVLIDECAGITHRKDAAIVAGAVHSGCEWIATYDRKHLLSQRDVIHSHYGITTTIPEEILAALGLRR